MANNDFLGIGWNFPPEFTKGGKRVAMVGFEEDIRQSLHILLSTRVKERVMQPTYGCNLDTMLFDAINIHLKTYVQHLVKTAIFYHEPRIKVENITVSDDNQNEGVLLIIIDYHIKSTNTKNNFVFPFYLNGNG
ncbi:MAG: GPW/gp25 family protein [Bacteroidota bacterium]